MKNTISRRRVFASILSKKLGLKKVAIEKPEVDIALAEFNRLKAVGEVK